MAIWKEQTAPKKDAPAPAAEPFPRVAEFRPEPAPVPEPPARATEQKESIVAAGLAIEGKIEGAGHVRIAGRFKGDVHVEGNLTIEPGAKLTGGVQAGTVTIGGELEGNIENAKRVELLASGVLNGDLKAGSLTVAAGSKMRGQVEFGWEERATGKPGLVMERSAAS
ncbi:MAG: bactofilin family protein [Gemmatimonadales bacterium]